MSKPAKSPKKLRPENRAKGIPAPKSAAKRLDISDLPPLVSLHGIVAQRVTHAFGIDKDVDVPNIGLIAIKGGFSVLANGKVEVQALYWVQRSPPPTLLSFELLRPSESVAEIRLSLEKTILGHAIGDIFAGKMANDFALEKEAMQLHLLDNPEAINAFVNRFPVLYHAVPKRYDKIFRTGRLVLNSAAAIRNREEAEGGDNDEGQFGDRWKISVDGYGSFDFSIVGEFWLLCLSENPNIAYVHRDEQMETYKVDMQKLLSQKMRVDLPDDLATIKGDAGKSPAFTPFGGKVEYTEEPRPGFFHKKTKWKNQQEIRIVIQCVDYREGRIIHPILTSEKLTAMFPPSAFQKLP